jgi:hypothetical protein
MIRRILAMFHALAFAFAIALGVVVPASVARADVSQTPVTTGCPAGYQTLTIEWLRTQGPYTEVGMVDTNGDGVICGRAWSDAAYNAHCDTGCPVPVIYILKDDDSPAQQS